MPLKRSIRVDDMSTPGHISLAVQTAANLIVYSDDSGAGQVPKVQKSSSFTQKSPVGLQVMVDP
jgi:hypothetical protein